MARSGRFIKVKKAFFGIAFPRGTRQKIRPELIIGVTDERFEDRPGIPSEIGGILGKGRSELLKDRFVFVFFAQETLILGKLFFRMEEKKGLEGAPGKKRAFLGAFSERGDGFA